jgi:hypothetical protein
MGVINIPEVSYGTAFGNVNKAVWFKPESNTAGYFDVNITVVPNTTISTQINIYNYSKNRSMYGRTYLPNPSQTPINDKLTITHNPTLLSQYYVLTNKS